MNLAFNRYSQLWCTFTFFYKHIYSPQNRGATQIPQMMSASFIELPPLFLAFPLVNKYYDWLLGLPNLTVWSLVLIFLPLSLFLQVFFFFFFFLWSCQKLIRSERSFPIPTLSSLFQFAFLEFSSFTCSDASILTPYGLPNSSYAFLSFVIQSVSHHFLQIQVVSFPVSSSFSFPQKSLLLFYIPSPTYGPRVDHFLLQLIYVL